MRLRTFILILLVAVSLVAETQADDDVSLGFVGSCKSLLKSAVQLFSGTSQAVPVAIDLTPTPIEVPILETTTLTEASPVEIAPTPKKRKKKKKKKTHSLYQFISATTKNGVSALAPVVTAVEMGRSPMTTPQNFEQPPAPISQKAAVPSAPASVPVRSAPIAQARSTTSFRRRVVDPNRRSGDLHRLLSSLLETPRRTGVEFDYMRFTEAQAAEVAVQVFGEQYVAFNPKFRPPEGHPAFFWVDEMQSRTQGGIRTTYRTGRKVPVSYEIDVVVDDPRFPDCCNIEVTTEHRLNKHKRSQLLRYTDTSGDWDFLNGGRKIILYAPNFGPEENFKIESRFGDKVRLCRTQLELDKALREMRR